MKMHKILAAVMAVCMLLSISVFATPDTSQGGKATSAPPDNSTKAIDILGTRSAVFIELGENGYTVTENPTDSYEVQKQADIATPVAGENNIIEGLYIACDTVDWDAENEVGNSGLIINALTDEETTFTIGGEQDYYEAPDGEQYNSVVVMNYEENEELPEDATETAPGVGIGFNGKSIELNNVYVESNSTGRPSIHIPSKSRDKNVTQLPDLVCVDTKIVNHSTRAALLMGGDVWFLNSVALTNSWGALSYDNTSTTMYVVNSDVENIGKGGYSIYDAAGCTAFVYGSKVVGGNIGITVCRTAELTVDSLENASETATTPYDGAGELMTASATEDGRTYVIAHDNPIMMHADMAGADSQATAYINNAYISTLDEDVQFADGTDYYDYAVESTGTSGLESDYYSGACILFRCHSGKAVLNNCELHSRTGILVHSLFNYDSMASGIYPVDGAEYVGDEVVLQNMSAEGDILHEDYMRKMVLRMENAELTGDVRGTTLAAWNEYWTEQVNALPAEELVSSSGETIDLDTALQTFIYNDTYETMWGVRMSMDKDSVWNVAGCSNLYSFTMEEGAVVQAADGAELRIWVDCDMDNSETAYDITTGTPIEAFEPGVEYTGVVIELAAGDVDGTEETDTVTINVDALLKALGL